MPIYFYFINIFSDLLRKLVQDETGVVAFLDTCCSDDDRVQTWVITFALKLWHSMLSSPHIRKIFTQNTNEEEVPSYVAVIHSDQMQVEDKLKMTGHLRHYSMEKLLLSAKDPEYWDEGSVRNAWLMATNAFIGMCDDNHQVNMHCTVDKVGKFLTNCNKFSKLVLYLNFLQFVYI